MFIIASMICYVAVILVECYELPPITLQEIQWFYIIKMGFKNAILNLLSIESYDFVNN